MSSLPWVEPSWDDVGLQCATTVLDILEIVDAQTLIASSRIVGFEVVVIFGMDLCLDLVTSVTVFDFRVERAGDEVFLRPQENSDWFLHKASSLVPAPVFREACAGLGALGVGAAFAGFGLVGACELQTRAAAVNQLVTGQDVVVGDVCSDEVVRALWHAFPHEAGLAAGFCCQPLACRGHQDAQARSLSGVLRAAFLLQSPWVVLEFISPSATNEVVRLLLDGFCRALHFSMGEVELELALVWSAQRKSWWSVLLREALPMPCLHSWEAHGPWRVVSDVLTHPQADDEELEQLMLSAHEVAAFSSRRSLESMVVRGNVPLPMALHAWGAKELVCTRPCRAPRVGPFCIAECGGALIRVQRSETVQYRHMTAKEMALLNGLSPETPLGDDGRVALALVGQIASPLQSCWVFAQLRRAVGPDAGSVNPIQLLTQQRWELLRAAERCGLRSIPASGLSADGDVAQTPCGADAVTLPAPLVRTVLPAGSLGLCLVPPLLPLVRCAAFGAKFLLAPVLSLEYFSPGSTAVFLRGVYGQLMVWSFSLPPCCCRVRLSSLIWPAFLLMTPCTQKLTWRMHTG